MEDSNKPMSPIKPSGMEIVFLYTCPFCERDVPMIAQVNPGMARCDACREMFPIAPVDERTIRYFKTMVAGGAGAVDPDFV